MNNSIISVSVFFFQVCVAVFNMYMCLNVFGCVCVVSSIK